jgi:hypothetical protein
MRQYGNREREREIEGGWVRGRGSGAEREMGGSKRENKKRDENLNSRRVM